MLTEEHLFGFGFAPGQHAISLTPERAVCHWGKRASQSCTVVAWWNQNWATAPVSAAAQLWTCGTGSGQVLRFGQLFDLLGRLNGGVDKAVDVVLRSMVVHLKDSGIDRPQPLVDVCHISAAHVLAQRREAAHGT